MWRIVGKFIAAFLGGQFFAILALIPLVALGVVSAEEGDMSGPLAGFVLWALGIVIVVRAPTAREAWYRLIRTAGRIALVAAAVAFVVAVFHPDQNWEALSRELASGRSFADLDLSEMAPFVKYFLLFWGLLLVLIARIVGPGEERFPETAMPEGDGPGTGQRAPPGAGRSLADRIVRMLVGMIFWGFILVLAVVFVAALISEAGA